MLDVKEAVRLAKDYVRDVYEGEEQILHLGLEETEYDMAQDAWRITLAFSRPFNTPRTRAHEILEKIGDRAHLRRSYKVLTVGEKGNVIAMKDRREVDA